jgi:hypothetical protein
MTNSTTDDYDDWLRLAEAALRASTDSPRTE